MVALHQRSSYRLYSHVFLGLPGRSPEEEDALNEAVVEAVNATGEAFLAPTRLRGRTTIRLAIGNIRTEERHVRRAFDLLREAAAARRA